MTLLSDCLSGIRLIAGRAPTFFAWLGKKRILKASFCPFVFDTKERKGQANLRRWRGQRLRFPYPSTRGFKEQICIIATTTFVLAFAGRLAERQCISHPSPINYRFRPKRKKRNKSSVKNNYCLSYTISPKVIDFSPNHFLIHYLDPQNATFCFSGFSFTKNWYSMNKPQKTAFVIRDNSSHFEMLKKR